ncbi:hypothetical protein SPRG_18125, partial [Saprolegnia parasitica CBS 223.65]
MEVGRVVLSGACAPYSSWNSSVVSVPGAENDLLSVVCEDGSVKVLALTSAACTLRTTKAYGNVGIGRFCHAWSGDGAFVAVAHASRVCIYDRSWALLLEAELPYFGKHIALTSTTLIVCTSNGAYVYAWDRSRMRDVDHVYAETPVVHCCVSPCGAWLALGATDGRIQIRRLEARAIELEAVMPSTRITSVVLHASRAIFAVKDGYIAVYKRDDASWRLASAPFRVSATPSPNAFVGYPSSTLVAQYGTLRVAAVAHSSQFIDLVDVESGRCVERVVLPPSSMLLGLAFVDAVGLVAHDVSGTCFLMRWTYGDALLALQPCKDAQEGRVDGSPWTLRRDVAGTIALDDGRRCLPAPFLPPTTLHDLACVPRTFPWSTFAIASEGALLAVALGSTIFCHVDGASSWTHWVAPHGVASLHLLL